MDKAGGKFSCIVIRQKLCKKKKKRSDPRGEEQNELHDKPRISAKSYKEPVEHNGIVGTKVEKKKEDTLVEQHKSSQMVMEGDEQS